MYIANSDINAACFRHFKDEKGAAEKVIYECRRGLNGRIPDCMLEMHAKSFNK